MGENDQIKDGPFSDGHERQNIRAAQIKTERMWPLLVPFVAVFENRKAIYVVFGLVGVMIWFTRPDIYLAVKAALGFGS